MRAARTPEQAAVQAQDEQEDLPDGQENLQKEDPPQDGPCEDLPRDPAPPEVFNFPSILIDADTDIINASSEENSPSADIQFPYLTGDSEDMDADQEIPVQDSSKDNRSSYNPGRDWVKVSLRTVKQKIKYFYAMCKRLWCQAIQ